MITLHPSNPLAAREDLRHTIALAEALRAATLRLHDTLFSPATPDEHRLLDAQTTRLDGTIAFLKDLKVEA